MLSNRRGIGNAFSEATLVENDGVPGIRFPEFEDAGALGDGVSHEPGQPGRTFVFGAQWPPVVIAAVILYPACSTKNGPLLRAFMALLAGAGLLVCTFILWIVILRPSLGVGP